MVRIAGVAEDVTDRTRGELRSRDLIESAPDAMVIIDASGQIVLVNAQTETLFGYERAELMGASVEILLPERYRERHREHRNHFLAAPRVRPMGTGIDLYARRKNGEEFPVEICSLAARHRPRPGRLGGDPRHHRARLAQRELARQRDALESANQDLARSNSELEQFASVASHDLQEPLRKLVSFSELLREDLGGELTERAAQDLEFITDAARRMRTLVRDLLTLSRTGTSEMKVRAGVARGVRRPRARGARPADLRDARRDHARSAAGGAGRPHAARGAVPEPPVQRAQVRRAGRRRRGSTSPPSRDPTTPG